MITFPFRNCIAILLCLGLYASCQQKKADTSKETTPIKKEKQEVTPVSPKKVKTPTQYEFDPVDKKNAVDFLKTYGAQHPETIVLFETRLGNIKIKLYKDTPLHRANFIFLTHIGYFNSTCFHRVVPNFIIQGGNSDHPLTRKLRTRYNYTIPPEIQSHRKHKYGALAAAREWENNPGKLSTPYEFYMIKDTRGSHHLDGEHTIFGEIIEGFDTMDKISKLKTDKKEWPVQDVFIKATVIK
jgi:peptidylprolyl isomerase